VTFSSCALAALAIQVLHSAKISNTFVNLSKKFTPTTFTISCMSQQLSASGRLKQARSCAHSDD
jgi:hypothetical protein